jgi:hypothetical protein
MVIRFPGFLIDPVYREQLLAFDPQARFESGLVQGRYFITSHVFAADGPRVFMLHEGHADGSVTLLEVSGKRAFDSRKEARAAMRDVLRERKTG